LLSWLCRESRAFPKSFFRRSFFFQFSVSSFVLEDYKLHICKKKLWNICDCDFLWSVVIIDYLTSFLKHSFLVCLGFILNYITPKWKLKQWLIRVFRLKLFYKIYYAKKIIKFSKINLSTKLEKIKESP
jgi:hypothetical protein